MVKIVLNIRFRILANCGRKGKNVDEKKGTLEFSTMSIKFYYFKISKVNFAEY